MTVYQTVNPATGEVLQEYESMTAGAALGVLEAVHAAQPGWACVPVAGRAALAARLAVVLRARKAEWARLISLEMGKPVTEALAELEKCAWLCEVYAEYAAAWLADARSCRPTAASIGSSMSRWG